MKKYAHEYPYWDTTVELDKSLAEIGSLVRKFGASRFAVGTEKLADERTFLTIGFQLSDVPYMLKFYSKEIKYSYGHKRPPLLKRAERQLGRIAFFRVKSLLTMADDWPEVMTAFRVLPSGQTVHEALMDRLLPEGENHE